MVLACASLFLSSLYYPQRAVILVFISPLYSSQVFPWRQQAKTKYFLFADHAKT